jgi:hypothetical protein
MRRELTMMKLGTKSIKEMKKPEVNTYIVSTEAKRTNLEPY